MSSRNRIHYVYAVHHFLFCFFLFFFPRGNQHITSCASSKFSCVEMATGTGSPGRPKRIIDKEQIKYLRSLRFTWNEIESLVAVSSKTLQRRAKEWNIEKYSNIGDDSLDQIVQEIKSRFPRSGEVMIRGHLNSQKVAKQATACNW